MQLRRILFWLVILGMVGLLAELILLEHMETPWQWIPVIGIVLGLLTGLVVGLRPGPGSINLFRGVMGALVLAGALGLYLHFDGNIEFEIENDPSRGRMELFWEALRGATPTLAPGALAQLGLLGLTFAYRHPALRPE